jgi:tetratricopeptide (TPR) repeat protein
MNEGPAQSFQRALELLNCATVLDPKFAHAYVEIGNCYAWLGSRSYISFEQEVSGMESAARKALEIHKDLAEWHVLLSDAALAVGDFVREEKETKRAIELNPNLASAYEQLAGIKATIGYLKQSLELHETALKLDPL